MATAKKKTSPVSNGKSPKVQAAPKKAAVKSAPIGRPSLYRPELADLAYKFCLLGANNDRLALLLEVAGSTVDKWIAEIPEFSGKVKEGREMADAEVAKSLFHRACGYSHADEDIRTVAAGNNQGSEIVITPIVKHYPPDTAAATLWLKNRQPTVWRDKVDHEVTGAGGGAIKHDVTLSADEAYLRMIGR